MTVDPSVVALCGLLDLFGVHPDEENALEWELLRELGSLNEDELTLINNLIAQTKAGLKRYISLQTLAEQFKVKPKVIRQLVKGGALRASTCRGALVFDQADIDQWLSTHAIRGLGMHAERIPDVCAHK